MNYVYQVENMPHAGPMTDGYVWRYDVLEIAARADAKIAELQQSITIRDTEIAELETAIKRQAAAVKMLDMSHVARAETMMQHAQVLHDQSNTAALESERQANALLTDRIAELEQSVTVRDTEIARLETDLELARRDAGRYLAIKPHVSPGLVTHIYEDGSRLTFTEWSFAGVLAGAFRGDTLDEAIDASPWLRKDAARAGNGGGV